MTRYGNGTTGVVAYELGPGWIRCAFVDGSMYVYDGTRPGPTPVREMQRLARAGAGLTTYINRHVRDSYARKEA